MLSAVYQQSHEVDAGRICKLDPANRYLWHFRPRRLEAEMIRDALLAVGGNLDPTMYRPEHARRHAAAQRLPAREAERADSDHDDVRRPRADAEHRRADQHDRADAGAGDDEFAVRAPAGREAGRSGFARRRTRRWTTAIDRGLPDRVRPLADATAERSRMLAFVEQQTSALGGDRRGDSTRRSSSSARCCCV